METEDVSEVAPEAPQPTHIDVHITQESVLAKLLLAGWSALQLPASASSRGLDSSRFLVTSWVRVSYMLRELRRTASQAKEWSFFLPAHLPLASLSA